MLTEDRDQFGLYGVSMNIKEMLESHRLRVLEIAAKMADSHYYYDLCQQLKTSLAGIENTLAELKPYYIIEWYDNFRSDNFPKEELWNELGGSKRYDKQEAIDLFNRTALERSKLKIRLREVVSEYQLVMRPFIKPENILMETK